MCDRSRLAKITFRDAIGKIVYECDRRGMHQPYTLRFTDANGTELEVVQTGDLNDISETKLRGGFKAAITVTVEDLDGRTIAGVIKASKSN